MFELKDPNRCIVDNCQSCQNQIDDRTEGRVKLILYKIRTEPQLEQDFYQYICDDHFKKYNNNNIDLFRQKNTPRNASQIVKIDEHRIDITKQHPCVLCHQSKQELCGKLLELIKYADTPEKMFYLAKSEVIQQFFRDKNLFAQLRMQIQGSQDNEQLLIISYLENLKRQYKDFDGNSEKEIQQLLMK